MKRFFLALFLLIALPVHAQQLNPGGGITLSGQGFYAVFPSGPVSITGGSGNGTDQISNVSVNGVMNALAFAGTDIGAKVNAAIAKLGPQGGTVYIPAGTYTFATTIQCPLTSGAAIIIEGASRNVDWYGGSGGTTLFYTGGTDAINQVISNTLYQNVPGCKIRDLTLSGQYAGVSAKGLHFGGTQYTETNDVGIGMFAAAGIMMENAANIYTERWHFDNTSLWLDGLGVYAHCDTGCQPSFGHGRMNIDVLLIQEIAVAVDGGGDMYDGVYSINGNISTGTPPIGPSAGSPAILSTTSGGFFSLDTIMGATECSGGCTRYYSDGSSGTGLSAIFESHLYGPWGDNANNAPMQITVPADGEMTVTHLDAGGWQPLPSISAGTFQGGSSDTFGEITNIPATGTTLTFGTPFNNPMIACTLSDDGQGYIWYTSNKTAAHVTFNCITTSGAACAAGAYVQYHCAGSGFIGIPAAQGAPLTKR
jgi:hypothetical protein